jgi:hypothetical protein
MDFLVEIHSWNRWVVLVALLASGFIAIRRALQKAAWSDGSERPFTLATIIFDLQLAIGIVLWIGNKGWDQDFFIKVIHPIGMILAVSIAHMAMIRARKGDAAKAYMTVGVGFVAVLIVIAGLVPTYAWS